MKDRDTDRRIIKYLLLAAVLVLGIIYFDRVVAAVSKLWGIVSPIVTGFMLAYVLNLLIRRINRIYFPRSTNAIIIRSRPIACILLAILAVLAAIALVVYIVLPQVVNAVSSLVSAVPEALDRLGEWFSENEQYVPDIAKRLNIDLATISDEVSEMLMNGGKGVVSSLLNLLTSVPGTFVNLFISFAFSLYMLAGKERLLGQLDRLQRAFLKPEHSRRVKRVLSVANETFSSFIAGQFTEALILGTLCTVGMWIFRFPYATTIGVFLGATALIPIIGAYLGAAVGAFLILMVNPLQALLFIVYVTVLQQIEGNLIYPRVVGTSIGLPGIWVMAAVIVGGGLGGIAGMLLGVPIAATAYKLLRSETGKRLEMQQGREA